MEALTDLTEWQPPVARYECPIGSCTWTHDTAGPDLSEGTGETIEEAAFSSVRAHLLRVESVVRDHLETHSLLEWVQEVMRLREDAGRTVRNASLVAVILLRRLGGQAEITDAEAAAEQGTLAREPVPHGFRLTVTG